MLPVVFSVSTVLLYLAATARLAVPIVKGIPDPRAKPQALALAALAVVLHGVVLSQAVFVPGGLNLGFFYAASLFAWVISAIVVIASLGQPLENLEWATAIDGDRAFADAQLANREREVLRLYAAGLPLKAVAERLGISYNTAKENITRIRVKYIEVGRPAPTKIDLLHRAIEDGLVDGRGRDDAHDDLAAR